MERETYLTNVYDKLKQEGFELRADRINNIDVFIGINKKFKLSWLATQMNSFAIIGSLDKITQNDVETFSQEALKYAIKNNQGLPRGLQSGIVSFSVLVSKNIDETAKQWVKERAKNIMRLLNFQYYLI